MLHGAQAKYLLELHSLQQVGKVGSDGRNPNSSLGDGTAGAHAEATRILREVSKSCPNDECQQQHAPYDNLEFLKRLGLAYIEAHRILSARPDLGQHFSLERPSSSEYKRWRSWQNKSLTNPMDCCGFDVIQAAWVTHGCLI